MTRVAVVCLTHQPNTATQTDTAYAASCAAFSAFSASLSATFFFSRASTSAYNCMICSKTGQVVYAAFQPCHVLSSHKNLASSSAQLSITSSKDKTASTSRQGTWFMWHVAYEKGQFFQFYIRESRLLSPSRCLTTHERCASISLYRQSTELCHTFGVICSQRPQSLIHGSAR